MARYNPSGDPNFTGAQPGAVGNQEGPYNPTGEQLFWGGSPTGATEDVNRYRGQASGARGRTAYRADLGGFNESRGFTMGALGDLRAAARGEVPSAAEIQGRQFLDTSLQNQIAAASGGRGGPANTAAAMRQASIGAAGARQRGLNDINAMRAQEQATARGQLAQTALASQGQDLGAQDLLQQSELAQRGLNQQGEQFYEGLGFQTRAGELNANLQRQQLADQRGIANRQNKLQEEQQDWGKKKDIISMTTGPIMGAIGGIFGSDPRTKLPMYSDKASKREARTTGYKEGIADAEAARRVAGRRRVGGYSQGDDELPSGGLTDEQMLGTDNPYWAGAAPYESQRPPGHGVTGAPQNYAAQRQGQPGGMDFSPASSAQGMAPGSADWARYGDPERMTDAELAQRPQTQQPGVLERMAKGFVEGFNKPKTVYIQQAPPPGQIPSGMMGKMPAPMSNPIASPTFSGMSGMLSGSPTGELKAHSDYATRFARNAGSGPVGGRGGFGMSGPAPMISDEAAKRAAFQEGANYAEENRNVKPGEKQSPLPGYMQPRQMKTFERDEKPNSEVSPTDRDYQAMRARQVALSAAQQRVAPPMPAPAYVPTQGLKEAMSSDPMAKMPMYSPPEAKNAVDIGDIEDWEKLSALEQAMAKAESGENQRMRSPKEFKRDTPADQKSIGEAYYARAGKEADETMNAYQGSLASSPSVGPEEGGAPSWLETYRSSRPEDFERTPDSQMAEANRAMAPSAYAYKDQFRPPEQHPGEVNVGPMADAMKRDDVAGTAVKRMPNGMLSLDRDKSLKLVMGGLSSVQSQLDRLEKKVGNGRR